MANDDQAKFIADLVEQSVRGLEGKLIAIWGLAFKPETDDVRESPSVRLAHALLERGANIAGHDPEADRSFVRIMAEYGTRVRVVDREYNALDGAHALVLMTEWRSYRAPNFPEIRKRLRPGEDGAPPVVIDGRNIWRSWDVVRAGLRYQGIGVPTTTLPPERISKATLY